MRWSTSNPAVLKINGGTSAVSNSGETMTISGVGNGRATITVSSIDGFVTASWTMTVYEHKVPLDITFDNACAPRMRLSSAKEAKTKIQSMLQTVYDQYLKFGLYMYTDSIRNVPSAADNCREGEWNKPCKCVDDSQCSNFTDSEYHHKNERKMLDNLKENGVADRINLMFTGHTLCYVKDDGTHTISTHAGLTIHGEPYTWVQVNSGFVEHTISTIFHELGHCYAVEDHYGDVSGGDPDCIWGDNHLTNSEIREKFIMCSECRQIIENNVGKYDEFLGA